VEGPLQSGKPIVSHQHQALWLGRQWWPAICQRLRSGVQLGFIPSLFPAEEKDSQKDTEFEIKEGQVLNSRYRVQNALGKGSFGQERGGGGPGVALAFHSSSTSFP